ncbi:MAG: hypothetical protein IIB25_08875 [Chloroflexi bacterium]|nr:hypothetical protein [Chloroflexota bacterium]
MTQPSTTKPAIPLQDAVKLANDLRVELLPYCERVWTGGSVRRHKPFVGDIELVCIPKPGKPLPATEPEGQADLFGGPPPPVDQPAPDDQLTVYLAEQCADPRSPWQMRPNKVGNTSFGPKNKLLTYNGSPIDVFSGTWANFGMLFFVRTGDARWVVQVFAEFKNQKRHGHPYGGLEYFVEGTEDSPGAVRAEYLCRDEERVFELLGWPFVNPDERTEDRASELRRTHH